VIADIPYTTASAVIGCYSGGIVCVFMCKDCYVFIFIMETAYLAIDSGLESHDQCRHLCALFAGDIIWPMRHALAIVVECDMMVIVRSRILTLPRLIGVRDQPSATSVDTITHLICSVHVYDVVQVTMGIAQLCVLDAIAATATNDVLFLKRLCQRIFGCGPALQMTIHLSLQP
jgi:hypothetical protein